MRMRIVGLSNDWIIVQIQTCGKWDQYGTNFDDFEKIMKERFPSEYAMYALCKDMGYTTDPAAEWFYNWGETREMRRHGDAYIFES